MDVVRIRSLQVARVGPLLPVDGGCVAIDMRDSAGRLQFVVATPESQDRIAAERHRIAGEPRRKRIANLHVTVDAVDHHAKGRSRRAVFLLYTSDAVDRSRRDRDAAKQPRESQVHASSSSVTAPSIPIDMPETVRPVSFAAPRIVDVNGKSTKSPDAGPIGGDPMRRE